MSSQNKSPPLVSILVPCFNHEAYVISCLESIKAQDYENIELLIIDDGSSDNSYSLVSQWCERNRDSFAKLKWARTSNNGITKTLKSLLNEAAGEFIAFCASDDCLTQRSVTLRINELVAHPSVGVVFGRSQLMDSTGEVFSDDAARSLYGAKSAYYHESSVKDELFFRWSMVGPASMYRRAALELAGGIDTNYLVEDRSLYLRLMLCSEIRYIDDIVAKYRYHRQSVSRSALTRAPVQIDIAKLHTAMASRFAGIRKLYLASFNVDLSLLNRRSRNSIFPILYLSWKVVRKAWVVLTMHTVYAFRNYKN